MHLQFDFHFEQYALAFLLILPERQKFTPFLSCNCYSDFNKVTDTVDTVDTVDTIDTVNTVEIFDNVDTVESVDTVYTVYCEITKNSPKNGSLNRNLLKLFNRYGIFQMLRGESSCLDGSEYVWQRRVESL